MTRNPKKHNTTVPGPNRIFAYGFDQAGFATRDVPVPLAADSQIEFIRFNDLISLEAADGVIIPQGIFERFETIASSYWIFGTKTHVWVHRSSMLERERQIFNILREGKWVCFLVGEIIDSVYQGIHLEACRDTDLCKRILNAFDVERHRPFNLMERSVPKTRDVEFQTYVRRYGRPATALELPHEHPIERRVLVELDDQTVGIEFDSQLFFLPWFVGRKDWATAVSVAKAVTQAISEYRKTRIVEIPAWVDSLRFVNEESLYLEINSLLEKVNQLESQLESWRDYKTVLTLSGMALKNRIITILESFFEFKVDPCGEDREDAVIMDDHHGPLAVMEARSTEKGFAGSLIDQFHNHRKRHKLPDSFPGVLFVNNDIALTDVDERLRAEVSATLAHRARSRNILIVRTVDLLFLMRDLENDPHRRRRLLQLFSEGGGWLKVDLQGYRVIS